MSNLYGNALEGDVTAVNTVLRVMAHQAMLMGWSRDQQGAARVVITDAGGPGGEPRRLELEFVLPGQRVIDVVHAQQPIRQPSPPRIKPEPTDTTIEKETTIPRRGGRRLRAGWTEALH